MNFILSVILSLCAFSTAPAISMQENFPVEEQDKIEVYIFLHESCLISQYYTLPLRELHAEFASEAVRFIGVFPNASSTDAGIADFADKYQLKFELLLDREQAITRRFSASITPEVVVYNASTDRVIYQGRIDNTYYRVGKKRQLTTSSELQQVLGAVAAGLPVVVSNEPAIGCIIQRF